MDPFSGLFSTQALRRFFGGSAALIERRTQRLPVAVERRQGPACENCGVGTLHPIPQGQALAGRLRCDRPGCGHLSGPACQVESNAMECVIRAS